jgi:hypothetical protein
MLPIGDLKKVLAADKATWRVHEYFSDFDQVQFRGTGGSSENLVPTDQAEKLDFQKILAAEPSNPFLLARQVELGYLKESQLQTPGLDRTGSPAMQVMDVSPLPPSTGGTHPSQIDWRNRWGWPWITSAHDQDGCSSCWAFAATALVESMVRIEHSVWCVRSEGDVHKGMGAVCVNTGGSGPALDWIRDHGVADPTCFPWTTADIAYTPTSDRSGRTVKIPSYTPVGSLDDQKTWIDTIGPLVTWFEVWADFSGYGNGIYRKQDWLDAAHTIANYDRGGHFLLVVGYDDTAGCWIVKNSWGTGWGQAGFGMIGYGECDIDRYSKIGLRYTNPDPLTKRCLHSGNIIESGNGSLHRNFEMLATANGSEIRHWWREGSDFSWHAASTFGNDAAVCPTLTATTYNRNFETVYLTTSGRLHHWFLDQASGTWVDGGVFGPGDAYGVPGLVQSNYGAPGNFEVVVRTADGRLNHWWRQNGPPWTWYDGGRFGSNVALSGPALIQSRYGHNGNLELVCVLDTGQMQHWWRDDDNGFVWNAGDVFGSGVGSPPCMIEGQFGATDEYRIGNFELCVAVGGQVQHWWRDNWSNTGWHHSATFGHDVQAVAGLVEGSFGFNLEVVLLRTDRQLQHYWRDGSGWHEGPIIGSAA